MSNSLDGWVWFGQLVDGDIAGITSASVGSSETVNITTEGRVITFSYTAYPNATTQIMRITGTTGRTARVWVDYILFDGPDAIIANKLKERGMKVSIEAVEWFKRTIIQTGDLNITAEEAAVFFAEKVEQDKRLGGGKRHQYSKDPKFKENFWKDWKKILGSGHEIKDFKKVDFSPVAKYVAERSLQKKAANKALTKDEKEAIKQEKYAW